ncbi:MAG: hypothetical protein V7K88_13805 [Nostoc sp.]|uniref:hypothetical protein n=1 Tax=Nostoc sp. TaxID=1180 RepID=UPI002FF88636
MDVVSSRGEDAIASVKEMTQGGAESVLECVGSKSAMATAIVLVERSCMLACRTAADRISI